MTWENIKNNLKPNASIWILFVAAVLIIFFFLWYFFFYIKSNEEFLIQKNLRVLTQISENFSERYNGYISVIKSSDIDSALYKKDLIEDSKTLKTFDQKKEYIKKYFSGLEIGKITSNPDHSYIYFSEVDKPIEKECKFLNKEDSDTSTIVDFKLNREAFFNPLQRRDIFEELIVIKADSSNKLKNSQNNLYYSSFQGDIGVESLDSLLNRSGGLSSGAVSDVNIWGIDYKLFLTYKQLKNGQSFYVGGVLSKESYNRETRAINYYLGLLIAIIFLTFLLSVPLIKLKVISAHNKLNITDLLLSVFSLVVGTFFILLVIFSVFNFSRENSKVSYSLKYLSDSIESELKDELNSIDTTLKMYSDSTKNKITIFSDKDKPYWIYNYFKLIFELNPDGDQNNIISSRNKSSTNSNYKNRRYFTGSGEWNLEGKKLMFDVIYSRSSGEPLGVVSNKKSDYVYVITSKLYSVINTILPPGYGFCVIDKYGNVKFHSDENRILRENFIKETEYPTELTGAVNGNLELYFSADYLGKSHSCYVKPFSTLPLHIVTFFDDTYAYLLILQVASLTILFLFLIILMFFTTIFISRIVVYRKSEISNNLDLIDWLRPEKWKFEMYRGIIITNIIAITFIVLSHIFCSAIDTLFIIYLFIPLQIINVLYSLNLISKKYSKAQYLPASFFVMLIFYISLKTEADILVLIIFCIVLLIFNFVIKPAKGIKQEENQSNKEHNSSSWYKLFKEKIKLWREEFDGILPSWYKSNEFYIYLFSWLCLIVIVPVIVFSVVFFNSEEKCDLRYNLYSFAGRESVRNYNLDKFYHDYVKTTFEQYRDSSKVKGIYYLNNIENIENSTFDILAKKSKVSRLDTLLSDLKVNVDTIDNIRNSLVKGFAETSCGLIIYKHTPSQVYFSDSADTKTSFYKGHPLKFGFNSWEAVILLISLLLLIFFAIYKLIKFTSQRIFGLSIKEKCESFSDLRDNYFKSGNNLIIQCPGFYTSDLDSCFSDNGSNMIDYEDAHFRFKLATRDTSKSTIIKNINLNTTQLEKEHEKYVQIINLLKEGNNQIVLVCNQSIEKLVELVTAYIKSEKDEKTLQDLNKLINSLQIMDKYFLHLYAPLKIHKQEESKPLEELIKDLDETLKKAITDEFKELSFSDNLLSTYKAILFKDYSNLQKYPIDIQIEKVILRIQELFTGYYERLWESCTNQEKLLLIDISKNLLLNDKNKIVIERLIQKGLLKKDKFASVDIMNKSFRNFVNSQSTEEIDKDILEAREKGKWKDLRAAILLILFAVAFFLAFQGNVLTTATSIISGVIGIITAITKIPGFFKEESSTSPASSESKNESKKESKNENNN